MSPARDPFHRVYALATDVVVGEHVPNPSWVEDETHPVDINKRNKILTGSQVLTIRATMNTVERDEIKASFVDPASHAQILVLFDRTTAIFVNLQAFCHNMTFLDVPESGNMLNQCVRRIYRMGQKKPQRV